MVTAFAHALGVDESEAREMLRTFGQRVRAQAASGPVAIDGLGTFAMQDGALTFEPAESLALVVNHAYADLRPLPMHRDLPEPPTEAEDEPDRSEPERSEPEPEPQAADPDPPAFDPQPFDADAGDEPVTGPLGELPMPPLFADDETLTALRDAGRDLEDPKRDPERAHRWADDLIREDDGSPAGPPPADPPPVSGTADQNDPDPQPEDLSADPDSDDAFDELPSLAPSFSDAEPELPTADEPPEIAVPENEVPEPTLHETDPAPPVSSEPAAPEPELAPPQGEPAEDPVARIAPIPSPRPEPAPRPERAPARPARQRRRSLLPLVGALALAALLGVAAMWWWLSRPGHVDPAVATAPRPADTVQAAAVPPPDTLAQALPGAEQADEPETPLRGRTPVTPQSGFTVVVGGEPTQAAAEALAARYRADGYRTGVLPGRTSRGAAIFRVGVGAFDSRQAAERARTGELQGTVPADAWVLDL